MQSKAVQISRFFYVFIFLHVSLCVCANKIYAKCTNLQKLVNHEAKVLCSVSMWLCISENRFLFCFLSHFAAMWYHAVFLSHSVFLQQDLYVCMVLWKNPLFLLHPIPAFAVTVFQNICLEFVLGFNPGLELAVTTKIRSQLVRKRQNSMCFPKRCVILTTKKEVIGKSGLLRVWPLDISYSQEPAHWGLQVNKILHEFL